MAVLAFDDIISAQPQQHLLNFVPCGENVDTSTTVSFWVSNNPNFCTICYVCAMEVTH